MSNRSCLVIAIIIAVLTGIAHGLAAPTEAAKPNIIFIVTDDLGWGDVGVFHQNARRSAGLPAGLTPHLDSMAAAGVRFTNHYCPAPVCAPSRASLLLGVTQGHANVRDNQFDKGLEDNHTLGTVLRQAGYRTAAIGKWGLQGDAAGGPPHWPAHPLKRGFDYYYGYMRHRDGHEHYPKEGARYDPRYMPQPNTEIERREAAVMQGHGKQVWDNATEVSANLDKCYTADLFTARAKKWIIDQVREPGAKPFFLYLAFDTPHVVLELPTQAYPKGGGLQGGLQWLGEPHHMINTASGTVDSWTYPEFLEATYRAPDGAEKPWPDVYRRYASSVRRIDDCVGDLLELLKDLKVDEKTLVVVTSDNGPEKESFLPESYSPEFFGSFGPFDGIKRDVWEGGLRVPTIARWPGRVVAGRTVDVPSALWDWLPTFADAAGLAVPARMDGISLLPEITAQLGQPVRSRPFYFEYFQPGKTPDYPEFEPSRRGRLRNQMQAIRLGDYMAVRYDIKSAADNFEIYDVAHDPKEAGNLGSDPAHAALQRHFKQLAIEMRRPDPEAPRPYDHQPMAAVAGGDTLPGGEWSYYEGRFPWVPNFTTLAPVASGTAKRPDVALLRRSTNCGMACTGYIDIPADGGYTFYLAADTGAFLRLHEASVIDADFGYQGRSERSGTVRLAEGLHPFRLYYTRNDRGMPMLSLAWKGPGFAQQPIPERAFRRAAK